MRGPPRLLVLVAILAGCAGARGGGDAPSIRGLPGARAALEGILRRADLHRGAVGVLFVRLRDGAVLLAHDDERLLPAASNVKLAVAAGALLSLGADFRFQTRVVATGPIEDGVLRGDLVLVASGDPNLSQRVAPGDRLLFEDADHSYAGFQEARAVPGDPLAVIEDLARGVVARGVRRVEGDIVVDDGLFRERFDDFVGPVSAACVNDNLIDVTIRPGARPGDPVALEWSPRLEAIAVRSEATTVEEGAARAVWVEAEPVGVQTGESPVRARFVVRGTMPARARPTLRVASFQEPASVAAGLLSGKLRALGVELSGRARPAHEGPRAYASAAVLARHESPPLSEAVRVILKTSQNLHASLLPPLLGALLGEGGDRDAGFRVLGARLADEGADPSEVSLQSGAGGGSADLLSARWTVELLSRMARSDLSRTFIDALPVGGVDGTLRGNFRDPALRGRVRAKTGTLVYRNAAGGNWVFLGKALSGYIDPGGEGNVEDLVAFSILIHGVLVDDPREGTERLLGLQEEIVAAVLAAVR